MISPDTPAGEALAFFRKPKAPPSDFALFATTHHAPALVDDVDELARRIHKVRGRATIQLVDDTLQTQSGDFPIVTVYRIDDGARTGLIGHAFIRGGGQRQLREALERIKRDRRPGAIRLVAN